MCEAPCKMFDCAYLKFLCDHISFNKSILLASTHVDFDYNVAYYNCYQKSGGGGGFSTPCPPPPLHNITY